MSDKIIFRTPLSSNAQEMKQIARDTGVLSVNSTYYYALMSRHFGETCLVVECEGQVCGYVIGYCPPDKPDTLFIWQVGVSKDWQGKGLGKKLLIALVERNKPAFVEATIAPDNKASINLFQSVARHFGSDHIFSDTAFFSEEDLGEDETPEHLMQIGPIELKF